MDEQKKEQGEPENTGKSQSIPTRSLFLMIFGGLYLLYTGYTLCKNVLEGQEGASWGFFAAGVIFVIIGAVMLFYGIKSYNAKTKAERMAAEAENAMEEMGKTTDEEHASLAEAADKSEPPDDPGKPMSISQRAKLTSRLEDGEKTEEE